MEAGQPTHTTKHFCWKLANGVGQDAWKCGFVLVGKTSGAGCLWDSQHATSGSGQTIKDQVCLSRLFNHGLLFGAPCPLRPIMRRVPNRGPQSCESTAVDVWLDFGCNTSVPHSGRHWVTVSLYYAISERQRRKRYEQRLLECTLFTP